MSTKVAFASKDGAAGKFTVFLPRKLVDCLKKNARREGVSSDEMFKEIVKNYYSQRSLNPNS